MPRSTVPVRPWRRAVLIPPLLAVFASFVLIGLTPDGASADQPAPSQPSGAIMRAGRQPLATARLSPTQTATSVDINTPEGRVTLTVEGSVARRSAASPQQDGTSAEAQASDVYSRQCTVSVQGWGAGNVQTYRMTLYSTFYWNYQTVWQQTPYMGTSFFWPYSVSNTAAWNTPWSPTVAFADGQGTLLYQPAPNIGTAMTWRLYIQEDAWGNCTAGTYRV